MEGLIPLVYKAIKRNRSRQQHSRSLSIQTPYFFVDDNDDAHRHQYTSAAAAEHGSATQTNYLYITPPAVSILQNATTDHHRDRPHHRRHQSVSVIGVHDRGYSFGVTEATHLDQGRNYYGDNNQQMTRVDDDHPRPKQLVRFRSHRSSLFSSCCISGAA